MMLDFTDNPDVEEDEPEVSLHLLDARRRGRRQGDVLQPDRITSSDNYGTDSAGHRVWWTTTEIWIMPSMNPDGTELGQRYNANGVDLNRNFPDQFVDPVNTTAGRPGRRPAALMELGFAHSTPRSPVRQLPRRRAGGQLSLRQQPSREASTFSPARRTTTSAFRSAGTYADNNPPMSMSNSHPAFDNGITNGADVVRHRRRHAGLGLRLARQLPRSLVEVSYSRSGPPDSDARRPSGPRTRSRCWPTWSGCTRACAASSPTPQTGVPAVTPRIRVADSNPTSPI